MKIQHTRRFQFLCLVQMLVLESTGNLPNSRASKVTRSAVGASCNVAANLISLNRDYKAGAITALADDAHGEFILRQIREMGVDNSSDLVAQVSDEKYQTPCMNFGAPIGDRGQVPKVRRKCDVMANLTLDMAQGFWDFESLMSQTSILHVCLHELGLNDEMSKIYMNAIHTAQKFGVTVMVNLNFRKSLFPTEADMQKWRHYCRTFAGQANFLVGSKSHALSDLGIKPMDEAPSKTIARDYPNLKVIALTGRDPDAETYSAEMLVDEKFTEINPRPCKVVWPIGSGDAFDAGLLYGLYNTEAWELKDVLSFAVNCARDSLSTPGDQLMATAEEILNWAPTSTRT